MSEGFTIAAAKAASTLFLRPTCNETIDSSAALCRFCGATVDHDAALKAAEVLSRVNQACSDASYIRSTALALPVFFIARLIPFVAGAGSVGFLGLLFILPAWSLVWWLRYGRLRSQEPDFRRARITVLWTAIGTSALLIAVLILFGFGLNAAHR